MRGAHYYIGDEYPHVGDSYRFTDNYRTRPMFRGHDFKVLGFLDADRKVVRWNGEDDQAIPAFVVIKAPEVKLSKSREYTMPITLFLKSSDRAELVSSGGGLDSLFLSEDSIGFIDSFDLED